MKKSAAAIWVNSSDEEFAQFVNLVDDPAVLGKQMMAAILIPKYKANARVEVCD